MRLFTKLALLCAIPVAVTAQADLTGAGATFPGPIYSKWFTDYAKTGVRINYQALTSGQASAAALDYAPLPKAIADRLVERLGSIRMAGAATTN